MPLTDDAHSAAPLIMPCAQTSHRHNDKSQQFPIIGELLAFVLYDAVSPKGTRSYFVWQGASFF